MDLNKLLSCHQVALIDMMEAPSRAAKRWAGERADYYSGKIIALRKRLGLPIHPFDLTQQIG